MSELTRKDLYTYSKNSRGNYDIYKNNMHHSISITLEDAEYRCHVLNNFDDLIFSASATNLVLYLDGREIGSLNLSQAVAEVFVNKIAKVFKTLPKEENKDYWEDVGWEYDD
jgi:hypothetical protein